MNFRTEIKDLHSAWKIQHQDTLTLIGSCFAENIGNKLTMSKFTALTNPFGILFNPLSVSRCIKDIVNNKMLVYSDLEYNNDEWFAYSHHSKFNHSNADLCLEQINNNTLHCRSILLQSQYLILTFGSAYAYRHKQKNIIVGNCHKTDNKLFERIFLSVDDITEHTLSALTALRNINPKIKIIFTISPIRYIKYQLTENTLSKAHLLCAIENIRSQIDNTEYFPSFEIMMDDLRDYRFYNSDMIHPSDIAIEYIWQKFCECYFSSSTMNIIQKANDLYLSRHHIIKSNSKTEIQKFAQSQLQKLQQLQSLCPFMDITEEQTYFESLIQ
ncbi:MAG: GSCFA domain-containing protein [Bacteroidales bacterium]|nr:GSCFA domain-containing protein [Bacteroidales bacterium]